jgi:hypothetical protein
MSLIQPSDPREITGRQPPDGPVADQEAGRTMGPDPASAAEVASAAPGDVLEVAFQVTACHPRWLAGVVVERSADGMYHSTGAGLSVTWPANVPVHMGTASDITPAAIVQAQGRLGPDGRLEPNRIAILTGYVELR